MSQSSMKKENTRKMVKIHLFRTLEINQNLAHKHPKVLIKKEKMHPVTTTRFVGFNLVCAQCHGIYELQQPLMLFYLKEAKQRKSHVV